MRKNFPGDEMAARKAYCGLEVEVTTPDGKTMILAVIDGFDVSLLLSPLYSFSLLIDTAYSSTGCLGQDSYQYRCHVRLFHRTLRKANQQQERRYHQRLMEIHRNPKRTIPIRWTRKLNSFASLPSNLYSQLLSFAFPSSSNFQPGPFLSVVPFSLASPTYPTTTNIVNQIAAATSLDEFERSSPPPSSSF